jgi:hydroxymethylbilane synthase
LIEPLADADTMVVASAERAVAQVLEATCQVPLAVHAVLEGGIVKLKSIVSKPDGKASVQAAGEAPARDAVALGEQVAADLLNNGAGDIIASL